MFARDSVLVSGAGLLLDWAYAAAPSISSNDAVATASRPDRASRLDRKCTLLASAAATDLLKRWVVPSV
jgi:hypothetical protein